MKNNLLLACALLSCTSTMFAGNKEEAPVKQEQSQPAALPKKSFTDNYINRWTSPRKAWGLLGAGAGVAGVIKFAQKAREHHAKVVAGQRRLTDINLEADERAEVNRAIKHHKRWRAIYAALAGGSGLVGGIGGWWFTKHLGIDMRDADLPNAVKKIEDDYVADYKKTRGDTLAFIDGELKALDGDNWKDAVKAYEARKAAQSVVDIKLRDQQYKQSNPELVDKYIQDYQKFAAQAPVEWQRIDYKYELNALKHSLAGAQPSDIVTDVDAQVAGMNDRYKLPRESYRQQQVYVHHPMQNSYTRRVARERALGRDIARQYQYQQQGAGLGWLNPLYAPNEPLFDGMLAPPAQSQ